MTELLEKAVETVRALPSESQDEGEPEAVDPAHLPAVLRGLEQARHGVFASEAEVEAAFRRFDP